MSNVVHCLRDPYDIYIGRAMPKYGLTASPWANPFRIGRDGTREEVVAKFEAYLLRSPGLMEHLPELRGRVLGCWCAPLSCHGDVLARHAAETTEESFAHMLEGL